MPRIAYWEGGAELLSRVGPLWKRLCAHHAGISVHFAERFRKSTFPSRRAELVRKGKNGIRVILASQGNKDIGYCVATVDAMNNAEVDSLYVADSHRGKGIGEALTKRALAWIKKQRPADTCIQVAVGNERALKFYAGFGFLPYTYLLREKRAK